MLPGTTCIGTCFCRIRRVTEYNEIRRRRSQWNVVLLYVHVHIYICAHLLSWDQRGGSLTVVRSKYILRKCAALWPFFFIKLAIRPRHIPTVLLSYCLTCGRTKYLSFESSIDFSIFSISYYGCWLLHCHTIIIGPVPTSTDDRFVL